MLYSKPNYTHFYKKLRSSLTTERFLMSESSLKVRKIALLYRFLISFLVPELLRFKDLKNDRKAWYRGLGKINQN